MEGVDVHGRLRIAAPVVHLGEDGLDRDQRVGVEARHVAGQAAPLRQLQERPAGRQPFQRLGRQGDAAGDRVALLELAGRPPVGLDLAHDLGEELRRGKPAPRDIAIPCESLAILRRDQVLQPPPPPGGHAMGQPRAPHEQAAAVQAGAPEDRVGLERLLSGEHLRQPEWREQPPQDAPGARHRALILLRGYDERAVVASPAPSRP